MGGFRSIADDQTLQNLTTITLNNLKSKPRLGAWSQYSYLARGMYAYTYAHIRMLISIKNLPYHLIGVRVVCRVPLFSHLLVPLLIDETDASTSVS